MSHSITTEEYIRKAAELMSQPAARALEDPSVITIAHSDQHAAVLFEGRRTEWGVRVKFVLLELDDVQQWQMRNEGGSHVEWPILPPGAGDDALVAFEFMANGPGEDDTYVTAVWGAAGRQITRVAAGDPPQERGWVGRHGTFLALYLSDDAWWEQPRAKLQLTGYAAEGEEVAATHF